MLIVGTDCKSALSGAFDGKSEIKFDAKGMTKDQYKTLMSAITDYLNKDKK